MPTYSWHDGKLHMQSSLNTGSIYRAKITISHLVAGCEPRIHKDHGIGPMLLKLSQYIAHGHSNRF